jgi:hypothetical protein
MRPSAGLALVLLAASCNPTGSGVPDAAAPSFTPRLAPVCPVCPVCPDATAPAPAPWVEPPATAEEVVPKESLLYHLVDQYEQVVFNHESHTGYASDCAVCHHHSSAVERTPPCRECHGKPSANLSLPGLRGAYHRQCMNCHREMGSGPLGCEECHKKRPAGAADKDALALGSLPDVLKLGHLAKEFGGVMFTHKQHVGLTDSCADCHHHEKEVERTPPCRECHNTPEKLKEAYHTQCLSCHRTRKMRSPQSCGDCHLPRHAPGVVALGALSAMFEPAQFDHEKHAQVASFCTDCHHSNRNFDEIKPCSTCHGGEKPVSKVGLLPAYHSQCIACHSKMGGPEDCSGCHQPKE